MPRWVLPAMSVAIAQSQTQTQSQSTVAVEPVSVSIATQITMSQSIATQVALANDGLRYNRRCNGLDDGRLVAQAQAESVASVMTTVASVVSTQAQA